MTFWKMIAMQFVYRKAISQNKTKNHLVADHVFGAKTGQFRLMAGRSLVKAVIFLNSIMIIKYY